MKTIGTATSNKGSFVVAAAAASGDVDAPPGWLPAKNLILQSVHNNPSTIKHFPELPSNFIPPTFFKPFDWKELKKLPKKLNNVLSKRMYSFSFGKMKD